MTQGQRQRHRATQGVTEHNRALPEPADATVVPFDAGRLRPARRCAAEHAERIGLAAERVDDVLLAVGEMAANSVRHGGGSGVLRLWTDAAHVVCEVADAGVIDDPLVGRRPAAPGQLSGRGLLMVNHLADLVRMHTTSEGTVVRVSPEVARSVWNAGPGDAILIVVSTKSEDPRQDTETVEDFWPEGE